MQIEEVITAPRTPFQNPYAERVIGSIRLECLDNLIIIGEDHLRRTLRGYFDYYHNSRPHQGLEELADSTRGRRAGEGQGHLNSTSRQFASLLPTNRLTLAIRLAPGDIDQINGETTSAG
jgi:hypothetical protein